MKHYYFALAAIITIGTDLLQACPYTFINDTRSPILVAEELGNAFIIPAGKKATIQAPMNENHPHDTEEWHAWHGHSSVLIYTTLHNDTFGNKSFEIAYKTREHICGKGSILKMSQLNKVKGAEDISRFRIKKMTEARKLKKLQKLAQLKEVKKMIITTN